MSAEPFYPYRLSSQGQFSLFLSLKRCARVHLQCVCGCSPGCPLSHWKWPPSPLNRGAVKLREVRPPLRCEWVQKALNTTELPQAHIDFLAEARVLGRGNWKRQQGQAGGSDLRNCPSPTDLSQVWADVVEVLGVGGRLLPCNRRELACATEPLQWKDAFVGLLEDQTNVYLISELLRRAACVAHWQTMRDRKPESSAVSSLSACLTDSLHERMAHSFFIRLVWNTTRTLLSAIVCSGMQYKFTWQGSSEDLSPQSKHFFWPWCFISPHPETSNTPSPQEPQLGKSLCNSRTTIERQVPSLNACRFAGHFVVFIKHLKWKLLKQCFPCNAWN